jgi:ADP-ribose pyrophosphatase
MNPQHPFDWQIVHSRYIVKDRWLSLRADRCQMPSGQVIDPYYVVESADFINVVPLTPDNEVVLVREYRHALGRTLLELVGGLVDAADASPLAAAQRELREETGYGGGVFTPLCVLSPNPGRFNNLSHSFLAQNVTLLADSHLDHTEQIEVVLLPLQQVAEMLRENQFIQAMHAAALFYALQQLKFW